VGAVSEALQVRQADGVATITLTRPDLGNAVTSAQAEHLRAALEALDADTEARVVILTGSGSSFNVGAYRPTGDDDTLADLTGPGRVAVYERQIPVMQRVIELLRQSSLISIAAVNGACAGAGLALALAADLRYAADTAGFNTAFLQAGLSGELGAIWLAIRLVGLSKARELFLLPGRSGAAELAELGLLNGVFSPEDLGGQVTAIARRIAGQPPFALAAMKANFLEASQVSFDEYLAKEHERMLRCLGDSSSTRTLGG